MLQGTIDEFPLIDVLGILQARNKTGRLEIERQAGRGLIYVRLGEPYYAESSLTRSLIGQKLVDIGAISDMQLRKALDRQAESGERLGQILLTHGVISADHVAQAVISQIKDALADLLAWEAGEFRWETGAEVEVEVPLFGADASLIEEGSNPLAPHVIPVTTQEPDTAPDRAEPEAVVEETDFPRGGTTMTGNEVTANPNETFPDAGQDNSHEDVHSSLEEVDDEETEIDAGGEVTDSESENESESEAEPEDDAEPESESESEAEDEDEPLSDNDEPMDEEESEPETEPVFDYNESEGESQPGSVENENASEPVADYDFDEADAESDTEPVVDYDEDGAEETVNEPEVEPVSEFDEDSNADETEQEDAQVTEPEDETVHEPGEPEDETEAVAEFNEDEDADEENETEPETGAELSPLTVESEARIEMPDQFHVPRIIRSQPAPELDEEFEAVFEATAHASYEVEPVAEPVEEAPYFDSSYADERVAEPVAEPPTFDPSPAVDPVFGADAFTPIAPVTEFDHPTFVPDNGSTDPVFDHGNFEPLPENPELVDPVAETNETVTFEPLAESLDEVPETSFESLPETTDEDVDEVPETSFDSLPDVLEPSFPPPFEPAGESADNDADEASESSFEPEVVAFDAPPPELQIEAPEPAFELPLEPVDEVPAPDPETDQPEQVQATPHMPAADLMPAVSLPPPPPETAVAEVDEDENQDADAAVAEADEDVASDDAPEPPGPVAPQSLKDIKLDRSSLVRELSDLLR